MKDIDLAFAPASELRELIISKQISPVEVTQMYLNRIGELDGPLNSYLTVTAEEAVRAAHAAQGAILRGDDLGILAGIPISIKDLEMTAGIRTTSGSLVYKNRIPHEDSVVVERVRKSGAIILGKTNTPEFGLLGRTENRLGEDCRNPWNTERTSGGSSGGAGAAVASGLCSLATGSDGGGSIRIPSSFCGGYGIKPTQGRVPYYSGSTAPTAANQFSQSGPMSRTVRDSALLLQVLSGHDPRDAGSLRQKPDDYMAVADRGVKGLRVGWSPDFGFAAVDPDVATVSAKAARVFEELGCTVEEASLDLESPFEAFWTLFTAIFCARSDTLCEEHWEDLTSYTKDTCRRGREVTGVEYALALGQVDVLKAKFANLFEKFDLLLSPTTAVPAFPTGKPPETIGGREANWFWGYMPFTFPINMIGYPAASIPCGFSEDGLPIGLQLVGRYGDESTVIAASAAFEAAQPWAQRRPKVS